MDTTMTAAPSTDAASPLPLIFQGDSDFGEVFLVDSDSDTSKWPKSPPRTFEPFLTSFSKFNLLPIEIRNIIWRLTLQARAIDVAYSMQRGFYSRTKTPVALKVCKESREAVVKDYPLCFSSVLFKPMIVCNFSIDTLVFDWIWQNRVCQFLAGMTQYEITHIQSIAVHHMIGEDLGLDFESEDDAMDLFRKAIINMPSMKEFRIFYTIDEGHHEHGFPSGAGPIELFEDFTYEWQQFMYDEEIHIDDEDGQSECQELPNSEHLTEGFKLPKLGSVWAWRPTALISDGKFLDNTPWFLNR